MLTECLSQLVLVFGPIYSSDLLKNTRTYKNGGNEERDRRLEVVKLLTAHNIMLLSWWCIQCVSAQKPCVMAGWVSMGGCGLVGT